MKMGHDDNGPVMFDFSPEHVRAFTIITIIEKALIIVMK